MCPEMLYRLLLTQDHWQVIDF